MESRGSFSKTAPGFGVEAKRGSHICLFAAFGAVYGETAPTDSPVRGLPKRAYWKRDRRHIVNGACSFDFSFFSSTIPEPHSITGSADPTRKGTIIMQISIPIETLQSHPGVSAPRTGVGGARSWGDDLSTSMPFSKVLANEQTQKSARSATNEVSTDKPSDEGAVQDPPVSLAKPSKEPSVASTASSSEDDVESKDEGQDQQRPAALAQAIARVAQTMAPTAVTLVPKSEPAAKSGTESASAEIGGEGSVGKPSLALAALFLDPASISSPQQSDSAEKIFEQLVAQLGKTESAAVSTAEMLTEPVDTVAAGSAGAAGKSQAAPTVTGAAGKSQAAPTVTGAPDSLAMGLDEVGQWLKSLGFLTENSAGLEDGAAPTPAASSILSKEAVLVASAQNPKQADALDVPDDSARQASSVSLTQTLPPGAGETSAKPTSAQAASLPTMVKDIVVQEGRYIVLHGDKTVTIKLIPESLGELRLEVSSVNDKLNVRLFSPNAGVREALEGNVQALRESLARNGIEVTSVSVLPGMAGQTMDQAQRGDTTPWLFQAATPTGAANAAKVTESAPLAGSWSETTHEGRLNVFA